MILNDSLVAGIGNAYADDILFAAGLHPYRKRTELSAEDEGRLYQAIRSVLGEAAAIVTERMEKEGLPVDEYRDHLKVHRRGGQPCPTPAEPRSPRSPLASASPTSAATASASCRASLRCLSSQVCLGTCLRTRRSELSIRA